MPMPRGSDPNHPVDVYLEDDDNESQVIGWAKRERNLWRNQSLIFSKEVTHLKTIFEYMSRLIREADRIIDSSQIHESEKQLALISLNTTIVAFVLQWTQNATYCNNYFRYLQERGGTVVWQYFPSGTDWELDNRRELFDYIEAHDNYLCFSLRSRANSFYILSHSWKALLQKLYNYSTPPDSMDIDDIGNSVAQGAASRIDRRRIFI
jgi:hypothetical protein